MSGRLVALPSEGVGLASVGSRPLGAATDRNNGTTEIPSHGEEGNRMTDIEHVPIGYGGDDTGSW
jgi:hypothetical protein